MGTRLIELNHLISHGMLTYPGLPGPEISDRLSRELEALPPTGFRFFAAPPRIAGMGTFPVRAFAIVA